MSKTGPCDFRDVENVDRFTKSSHKNLIYHITRNIMELAKFWINTSKSDHNMD